MAYESDPAPMPSELLIVKIATAGSVTVPPVARFSPAVLLVNGAAETLAASSAAEKS